MDNESDTEEEMTLEWATTLFVELYGISEECIELSVKLDRELELPLGLESAPEVISESVTELGIVLDNESELAIELETRAVDSSELTVELSTTLENASELSVTLDTTLFDDSELTIELVDDIVGVTPGIGTATTYTVSVVLIPFVPVIVVTYVDIVVVE